MSLLSKDLLIELGIELNESDCRSLSEHFDTTLQNRVINEIVEELNPDQAKQLAEMLDASDDELLMWLKVNVPSFSEIVSDEVDILLGELAENSEALQSNQL